MRTILIWSKLFNICTIFMTSAYHIRQCLSSFILTNCINSHMSNRPVTRVGDFHVGHFCLGTGIGFHATPYITGSTSVLTNGRFTCTMGSVTLCGDKAITGAGSVLVNGKPIHRMGDATSGHSCNEATTETYVVDGTTVTATDFTCKLDGGYFHPTFSAMGSGSVNA